LAFEGPDYLALPTPTTPWLIPQVLPVGGTVNLYGKPKTKKSFIALQLAAAIADETTTHCLGFPIVGHGPTLYVQLDTPRVAWSERMAKMRVGGIGFSNVYIADRELESTPYPFDILADGYEWLKAAVRAFKPVLTVIDTLREAHQGDENVSDQMQQVVSHLVKASHPSALLLVSHARKEIPDRLADLMNDGRGSSYVAGRMDCVMAVGPESLTFAGRSCEETRVGLDFDEDRHCVVLKDRVVQEAWRVLAGGTNLSDRQLAEQLAGRLGGDKSREACRSLIRRLRTH
jgi:RecA-family ATPase